MSKLMRKCKLAWGDLAYQLEEKGEQTYILVHNAGGSHHFLKHTFTHFSPRARVLSVDLKGHGQSDVPDQEYTVESYAEDILNLCQKCGLNQAIFIGLNFGACIGIALSQMQPQVISKLIMIEPPILMESWIISSVEEHIKDLQNPNIANYAVDLVDTVITQACPKEREMAKHAFEKTPRHVQISTYKNLLNWNQLFEEQGKISEVPTLYIQSSMPFSTEEKVQHYFKSLYCGRVIGSGPWATLEVPNQVHSMIERFLTL